MPQISRSDLIDAIVAARQRGEALAEAPSIQLHQGYEIAEAVAARLGTIAGWKVGATNPAGQASLGIEEPIRGRIYQENIRQSPAALSPTGGRPCEIEPEIVIEVAAGGRPARAWPALEIVRPSRDDAMSLGAGFIVADNAAHVALVIGPEIPLAALACPHDIRVELMRNSDKAGAGSADAVLGDPRRSVEWLAGKGLIGAGDLVATGAICRAALFQPGDSIEARFPGFGVVAAHWPHTE